MNALRKLPLVALVALALGGCSQTKKADATQAAALVTNAVPTANATAAAPKPAEAPNPNPAVIQFAETEHDFGSIRQGEVVEHVFKFTNVGKSPLIIQNASAPCGCTVPEWPKDPIAPNATGEIKVKFNSAGKSDQQNKVVSIIANTQPELSTVTMKGNVTTTPASTMNGPLQ